MLPEIPTEGIVLVEIMAAKIGSDPAEAEPYSLVIAIVASACGASLIAKQFGLHRILACFACIFLGHCSVSGLGGTFMASRISSSTLSG